MSGLARGPLMAMLSLQASMNAKVNPDWLTAGYPWLRAVIVEGAEAMDHYGWKWWKKQAPDMEQFRIELVDIWHFALSNVIQGFNGDFEAAAEEIEVALSTMRADMSHAFRHYRFESMDILEKVELMIALAGVGKFSFKLFESIMFDAHMDWETLHVGYVSKNVLNFFRQDNGYKAGTYVKHWFGEEDNVVLAKLTADMDKAAPDFDVQLYKALEVKYAEVLASAQPVL